MQQYSEMSVQINFLRRLNDNNQAGILLSELYVHLPATHIIINLYETHAFFTS